MCVGYQQRFSSAAVALTQLALTGIGATTLGFKFRRPWPGALPSRFREGTAHVPLHVVGVKVFAVGTVELSIGSECKCAGILL